MKTVFTIGLLIFFGLVANFLIVLILNIAGIPGALVAGLQNQNNNARFWIGAFVASLGQLFIYLAYVAFIVNWTSLAISLQGVSIIAWPVAFLAVVIPIYMNLIRARLEAREIGFFNAQVQGLHLTTIFSLIAFFAFAFFPSLIEPIYGWVPYVRE